MRSMHARTLWQEEQYSKNSDEWRALNDAEDSLYLQLGITRSHLLYGLWRHYAVLLDIRYYSLETHSCKISSARTLYLDRGHCERADRETYGTIN